MSGSNDVGALIREYVRLTGQNVGNAQNVTAHVNLGSPWITGLLFCVALISATCCGFMAGQLSPMQSQINTLRDDIRATQDYVNVLYRRNEKESKNADHHP